MKRVLFVIALFPCCQFALADAEPPDPFSDNVITCEEMNNYPEWIFGNAIDLGSGSGSPIEVDYDCPDGLGSQAFMKRLDILSNKIRSEEGPQSCTGTIVNAHWRYHEFDLLAAGIAPALFVSESRQPEQSELRKYFAIWAHQSATNFSLYQTYLDEENKVRGKLSAYYKKKFNYSNKIATLAANRTLSIYLDWAAGTYPGSAYGDGSSTTTPEIVQIAQSPGNNLARLKEALSEDPQQGEIDDALKAALLHNKSTKYIGILIARLDQLNQGKESALFFTLRNRANLKFLIKKGADVNYANEFGKTPIFYTIGRNDHDTTKLLLEYGANPNATYKSADELRKPSGSDWLDPCIYPNIQHTRRTPLMHAAQHSDPEMLQLLLKNSAQLDAQDDLGYNALDYAIEHNKFRNEEFLKSLGLKPSTTKRQY